MKTEKNIYLNSVFIWYFIDQSLCLEISNDADS